MCVLFFVCDGQFRIVVCISVYYDGLVGARSFIKLIFHSISVNYDGQFRLVRLFNLLGNGQFEARLLYFVFYCRVTFVFLSSILMARLGSLSVTQSITMA